MPHSAQFSGCGTKKRIRLCQVRMQSQKNWRVNRSIDPPCDYLFRGCKQSSPGGITTSATSTNKKICLRKFS
jgi:hypothetical protein